MKENADELLVEAVDVLRDLMEELVNDQPSRRAAIAVLQARLTLAVQEFWEQ